MVLRTPGVRTHFRMDIELPTLGSASYNRIVRSIQRSATRDFRRKVTTPQRRKLPRNTGQMRKRFRNQVGRRPAGRSYFTITRFRHVYYLWFHEREYTRFRRAIEEEAADIILEALTEALREEGFR